MKPIADAAKDLSRFRGWTAQLWAYSVSHARCVIRFYSSAKRQEVFLICFLCERIAAPTHWGVSTPKCTQQGEEVVFTDEGVEIRGRYVNLVDKWKGP